MKATLILILSFLSLSMQAQTWTATYYGDKYKTRRHTAKSMVFRYDGLRIGRGNTQLGAPADRDVFIISLGERYK